MMNLKNRMVKEAQIAYGLYASNLVRNPQDSAPYWMFARNVRALYDGPAADTKDSVLSQFWTAYVEQRMPVKKYDPQAPTGYVVGKSGIVHSDACSNGPKTSVPWSKKHSPVPYGFCSLCLDGDSPKSSQVKPAKKPDPVVMVPVRRVGPYTTTVRQPLDSEVW